MRILVNAYLCFSLLCFTSLSWAGKYNSVLNIGDSMPKFENLPSINGEMLSSDDLQGDVIVLVSLANHCPWVRGMDKDLIALVDSVQGKNVDVVGLSVNHRKDDRLPAMHAHAKKHGYNFVYIYDESQKLGRELGATRTPEYFVFDKLKKLVYTGALYDSPAKMNSDGSVSHINGEPTKFYVHDAINSTLNNSEVAIKETRAHGCSVKYVQ